MPSIPTGSPDEPLCERCEKNPVSALCEQGLFCEECISLNESEAAEDAHERDFTNYWEGNGPLTLDEQHESAWHEKHK